MSNKNPENIANTTGTVFLGKTETTVCPDMETLYFEMEDQYHVFQIGLPTLLDCLFFAAKEQKLPEIPLEWYKEVCSRYDIPFGSQYVESE